jgi:hypothetical protein
MLLYWDRGVTLTTLDKDCIFSWVHCIAFSILGARTPHVHAMQNRRDGRSQKMQDKPEPEV